LAFFNLFRYPPPLPPCECKSSDERKNAAVLLPRIGTALIGIAQSVFDVFFPRVRASSPPVLVFSFLHYYETAYCRCVLCCCLFNLSFPVDRLAGFLVLVDDRPLSSFSPPTQGSFVLLVFGFARDALSVSLDRDAFTVGSPFLGGLLTLPFFIGMPKNGRSRSFSLFGI